MKQRYALNGDTLSLRSDESTLQPSTNLTFVLYVLVFCLFIKADVVFVLQEAVFCAVDVCLPTWVERVLCDSTCNAYVSVLCMYVCL